MAKDTTPVEATEVDALETVEIAPVVETTPAPTVACGKDCKVSGYCHNCGKTGE